MRTLDRAEVATSVAFKGTNILAAIEQIAAAYTLVISYACDFL